MWSGQSSNIPSGWALCNGQNGTPNLQDRFIVGAGNQYSVGATGGANEVTLTTAQMPSHSHTFTGRSHTHSLTLSGLTCSSAGDHVHSIGLAGGGHVRFTESAERVYTTNVGKWDDECCASAGSHTHTISGNGTLGATTSGGTNSSTGSGQSHENRPPYYALCFIMKL